MIASFLNESVIFKKFDSYSQLGKILRHIGLPGKNADIMEYHAFSKDVSDLFTGEYYESKLKNYHPCILIFTDVEKSSGKKDTEIILCGILAKNTSIMVSASWYSASESGTFLHRNTKRLLKREFSEEWAEPVMKEFRRVEAIMRSSRSADKLWKEIF